MSSSGAVVKDCRRQRAAAVNSTLRNAIFRGALRREWLTSGGDAHVQRWWLPPAQTMLVVGSSAILCGAHNTHFSGETV